MIKYLLSTFLLLFTGCGGDIITNNKSPIANITVNKTVNRTADISAINTTITIGSSITLDGSDSFDSDGSIASYAWQMGDNQTFNTPTLTWTPNAVGSYTVTLIVTDNQGATSSPKSITINVLQELISDREIFLIGDSTVHVIDNFAHFGWGQRLHLHIKDPSKFYNRAYGGVSSRSYKSIQPGDTISLWDKLKNIILDKDTSTGAYLMIQLGNNDIGTTLQDAMDTNTKTTMPGRNQTFYNELKEYITWAKEHNITPVLVTPVETMEKKYNGNDMESYFYRSYLSGDGNHGDYAQTIRELATDENIIMLDLQKKSWEVFNSYDQDNHAQLILDYGIPDTDRTHFNSDGATEIAKWVTELACDIQNGGDIGLCSQFK